MLMSTTICMLQVNHYGPDDFLLSVHPLGHPGTHVSFLANADISVCLQSMQKVDSTESSRLETTITIALCETTIGLIPILRTIILVVGVIDSLKSGAVRLDWRMSKPSKPPFWRPASPLCTNASAVWTAYHES